ncbi:MAG: universal stress protein [Lentisphaerae bacterium]|jgi:nucleotide-binding universal stress UspA family protein|nr:universal stress protein [Lentisphaerota bacterium]
MLKLNSILCPVDFSETSDLAVQYALAIARTNGASLTLLHVVAPAMAALPGEAGLLAVPQIDLQESTDACLSRLAAIAEEIEDEGVEVDYKVVSGVPFLEISRYAGEQDTDMIVMGSRGRSGLGHLLIGSVAERVLRKAPCPVLTVKERVKTSKLEEEEEEQVSTLCSYALSKAEEQAAAVSLTNISSSIPGTGGTAGTAGG